jgi:hypothetical protein
MSRLNSATKEQRELIRQLIHAAHQLPPITDKQEYDDYQARIMQPIRDAIRKAGN